LVSVAADTRFGYGARKWLKFDYLTPLPMARALVEETLLSPDEIAWIDDFHANTCWAQVAPMLKGTPDEARTRDWLWRACRPLGEAACPDVPH
jgi:Xaa-Pro aminopeptidase